MDWIKGLAKVFLQRPEMLKFFSEDPYVVRLIALAMVMTPSIAVAVGVAMHFSHK